MNNFSNVPTFWELIYKSLSTGEEVTEIFDNEEDLNDYIENGPFVYYQVQQRFC